MTIQDAIAKLKADNAIVFANTQAEADERIPALLESPAEVRAVCVDGSNAIDFEYLTDPRVQDDGTGWAYKYWDAFTAENWCDCRDLIQPMGASPIDWLIILPVDKPAHPDNVRAMVKQAEAAGVPVWLEWELESWDGGPVFSSAIDGREFRQVPEKMKQLF